MRASLAIILVFLASVPSFAGHSGLLKQFAQREQGTQSLTCPEQLADLNRQYLDECKRFGAPPLDCEKACPAPGGNCPAKCDECQTIATQIERKTQQCGK
jgi:hypothetical protein